MRESGVWWSDDEVATLTRLYCVENMSAARIVRSRSLPGRTLGAVLGEVYRRGLKHTGPIVRAGWEPGASGEGMDGFRRHLLLEHLERSGRRR